MMRSWRARRTPEIRDELEKLQQNLAIVRGKLDNLIVRAPVSGRLTDLDLKVAQLKLRSLGIGIDRLSKEQRTYNETWREGT